MDFDTGSGGNAGSGGSTSGPGGGPPSAAAAAGGDFDYRDPLQSFIRTTRAVLTQPAAFFQSIRRNGDFINPLIFAIICSLFLGVLGGFFNMLNAIAGGAQGVGGAIGSYIGSIILTPILMAVILFIGAGIYYLLVLLFARRSNAGYEATFRVACYACAIFVISWITSLFNLIPVIGPVIGGLLGLLIAVYAIVIQVLGIREVHSITTGRAAAVVLLPTVVILLLALLIVGTAILVILGAQQS